MSADVRSPGLCLHEAATARVRSFWISAASSTRAAWASELETQAVIRTAAVPSARFGCGHHPLTGDVDGRTDQQVNVAHDPAVVEPRVDLVARQSSRPGAGIVSVLQELSTSTASVLPFPGGAAPVMSNSNGV